jgi:hypothetical protein
MGVISAGIGAIVAIGVTAVGGLVSDDLREWAPRIGERIVRRAVARLPPEDQERMGEEWRSHINDTPGTLTKLWEAAGCLSASRRIAAARSRVPPAWLLSLLDRLLSKTASATADASQFVLLRKLRKGLRSEFPELTSSQRDSFVVEIRRRLEPELQAVVRSNFERNAGPKVLAREVFELWSRVVHDLVDDIRRGGIRS